MKKESLVGASTYDAYELIELIYDSADQQEIELLDVEALLNQLDIEDRPLNKVERKSIAEVVTKHSKLVGKNLWTKCYARFRKRLERRRAAMNVEKPGRIQVSAATKKQLDVLKKKRSNGELLYSTYDEVILKLLASYNKKKKKGKK